MDLTFLTPAGALFALGAIPPVALYLVQERRAHRVRRNLALEGPPGRARIPVLVALSLIPILLGIALAQPVLRSQTVRRVRKDVEIYYVFDTSTSMSARRSPTSPTRLARALRDGLALYGRLNGLKSGIATMTDRVLPDDFPGNDEQTFVAVLQNAVTFNGPPPKGLDPRATTFAALDNLAGTNFFDAGTSHRVVVLFTDGETSPYIQADLRTALHGPPKLHLVVLRYGNADEHVYTSDGIDRNYRPDPASERDVKALASLLGGQALREGDIGGAASAVHRAIGTGPLVKVGVGLHVVDLSRWFVLAALLPLGALLWRRNVV